MSYFCHIISLKMDNAYGQLMGSKVQALIWAMFFGTYTT